jgi:hypothetical protein
VLWGSFVQTGLSISGIQGCAWGYNSVWLVVYVSQYIMIIPTHCLCSEYDIIASGLRHLRLYMHYPTATVTGNMCISLHMFIFLLAHLSTYLLVQLTNFAFIMYYNYNRLRDAEDRFQTLHVLSDNDVSTIHRHSR